MAQIQFDATSVPPDPGRGDPIPAGWYNGAMEKSENKPTAAGDGSYLECVFGVLDGQYQGRKLYHRFNLVNNNAQAKEIAYKQFSAVCHAVGHLQVNDSTELHGRPLKLRVKIDQGDAKYEPKNEITAFKNINETTAATTGAPAVGIAPAVIPPSGWQAPPQAQPWAAPAAAVVAPPPVVAATFPPVVAATFPPAGWIAHPSAPGYFYMGQEVLTEAALRARMVPAAPVAPPLPPAAAPAWQAPAGAPAQPWAAPPVQAAAPVAPAVPSAAAAMAPAFSPPPVVAPPGAPIPPWQRPPGQ